MIEWLNWIILALLIVVSMIDFKFKAVPSIFLTGILFIVAFLNPANLWFGIIGFIMAILLYEADFFSGYADIKVMTIIAFMLNTTNEMFLFIFLTLLFGVFWKGLWNIRFRAKKRKMPDEFPFLPVFLFCYIVLMFLGVV